MKRMNTITIAGFAVCGVLLGMKALDLVEAGITLLLMVWGGYAYGAAAARAPLILLAVLATAAGLALSLYELHRENQQYKKGSKVHKQPQHTVKPANRRKAGQHDAGRTHSGAYLAVSADAAGLSYGQYMLLKASKKPAGAATPTSRKK